MGPLMIAAYSAGGVLFFYLFIFKILGLRVINSNESPWWKNGGALKARSGIPSLR